MQIVGFPMGRHICLINIHPSMIAKLLTRHDLDVKPQNKQVNKCNAGKLSIMEGCPKGIGNI